MHIVSLGGERTSITLSYYELTELRRCCKSVKFQAGELHDTCIIKNRSNKTLVITLHNNHLVFNVILTSGIILSVTKWYQLYQHLLNFSTEKCISYKAYAYLSITYTEIYMILRRSYEYDAATIYLCKFA